MKKSRDAIVSGWGTKHLRQTFIPAVRQQFRNDTSKTHERSGRVDPAKSDLSRVVVTPQSEMYILPSVFSHVAVMECRVAGRRYLKRKDTGSDWH